jgi:hypothetical protein
MKRKIIQIAVAAAPAFSLAHSDDGNNAWETLFVLCSDGTLWEMSTTSSSRRWHRVELMPEDE